MVCVDDVTFRLERLSSGFYEVIRLSDESCAGRFALEGKVRLEPVGVDAPMLRRIAREAIQRGKTSWLFHQSPSPPPVAQDEGESAEESGPLTPRRLLPI
jgi:hypothetical protein